MHDSNIKRVFVTGNCGYVGSVLTTMLSRLGYTVIGYDTHYFKDDCSLYVSYDNSVDIQYYKDIRDISLSDMINVDAVIHLAALSNDPLSELNPSITEDINYHGTVRVAEIAKQSGVKRFIYSSSQSMYGIAKHDDELDEDKSEKNPLTMYAKTKWMAELELKKMHSDDFTVTCFRPSTVFGKSQKLRCDIVFNNLVASAFTTGAVEIKSDGSPWRPVVHVEDVCNAFIAGLRAPKHLVANQSFNVGIKNGNYTVRELGEAAQALVSGASLKFTGEHGSDSRTYKVCFNKILSQLGDYFLPKWDLLAGGRQLVQKFEQVGFTESDFRHDKCNRLLHIKQLISDGMMDENLRWKKY